MTHQKAVVSQNGDIKLCKYNYFSDIFRKGKHLQMIFLLLYI